MRLLHEAILLTALFLVTGHIIPGDTYSNCIEHRRSASCGSHLFNSGFRTIDGTCNNLERPTEGSQNTQFYRFLEADYVDGRDTPKGFPGTEPVVPPANQVSQKLFKVENQNKGTGSLTVLFMTFGQFLDHDLALTPHPSNQETSCTSENAFKYPNFPILFNHGGEECTGFSRSQPTCQNNSERRNQIRNQINELTAFIDGSQIYGSELAKSRSLRKIDGKGTLEIEHNGLLTQDKKRSPCLVSGGCSLAGDKRSDENIALLSMHTVWVREHNRIAKELKVINPKLNGEKLYQTARKIVGGIMQHIVYTEWLPKLVRLETYNQYNSKVNPTILNAFTAAAFRFGHSLIPAQFSQLNKNFDHLHAPVTLQNAFRNSKLIHQHGIEPTMFGLVGNRSNNVDSSFAFGIVRRLFVKPGKSEHMDLTAFNIQRGRDHGIPNYGRWREKCRLQRLHSFKDLNSYMLPGTVQVLQKLYKHPNDIDLFAAGISEKHEPGLQVGPTFACILGYQFKRLRDGDRYFYMNRDVFTSSQLNEIKKASMARVLCNTLKEIVSIQSKAFEMSTEQNKRISCSRIPKLNLYAWKH